MDLASLELYLIGKTAILGAVEIFPADGVAVVKASDRGGLLHNVRVLVKKVLGSGYECGNLVIRIGRCVVLLLREK